MPDKMRIEGLAYPDLSDSKSKSATNRISPIQFRHFTWLVVIAILALGIAFFGTPHLRYIYTYTGTYEQPYYLTCDYVGWNSQRIVPRYGQCSLIMLLKSPRKER